MNKPKGKLIALGGAIDRGQDIDLGKPDNGAAFFELGILKRMLNEMRPGKRRIEIITTASQVPHETGKNYVEAFRLLEHDNLGEIHIQVREDVTSGEYQQRIEEADGILFTGGNQLRLTTILGGTQFLRTVHSRYEEEDFVVAGTSAGAMAMSNTMIYGGSSHEALRKGEVKISRGFGLINDVTIDSHFVKRGRFGRLCQTIASNPACLGIGLGEDTGLLITEGYKMEAIGSGLVIIVDGNDLLYTNVADIEDGEPISIENLKVHILSKGDGYDIPTRTFIRPKPQSV